MSVISCQNVCVSFAQRDILKNVSFEINKGDRIGLVGANGSGKTTLFKTLCGELEPTDGAVVKAAHTRVGFVEQHACKNSTLSVYDELLTVFSHLKEAERELEALHEKIESTNGAVAEYIEKQAALTERYQSMGGLTYEAMAHSCLLGLGFTKEDEALPVSALSGGQRTKLSLGKLLLSEPELMLLDEPTNHLDIASVEWLEDFLLKFKGSLVVISHDRYFLDKITSRTIELSAKRAFCYKGGYSQFVKSKTLRLETDRCEYEKGMLEIKRIEKMIEQQKQFNRERNYITIASKEKQIERIKENLPELPPRENSVRLRFAPAVRSGDEVLVAEGLSKAFGDKTLFRDVAFTVRRGEKVFLLGPNGCGKSTLLGLVTNKMAKDSGFSRFGHGVSYGFFEQSQQTLMTEKTVLMYLYDVFPTITVPELRGYLGAFNFKNDDIEKRMCDISGGERARVALLTLILKKPNFLILDEPTNHLDFNSRETLEKALDDFDGTILCVSHDRYFVNRLATRILSFDGEKINSHDGNYDGYVERMKNSAASAVCLGVQPEKKVNDYKLRKERESLERKRRTRLVRLEELLAEKEAEKDRISELLQTSEISSDYEKVIELTGRLGALKDEIDKAEAEWLELSEEM